MNRILSVTTVIFVGTILSAAIFPVANLPAQETRPEVAAWVGDEQILVSQVEREFQARFAERQVGEQLAGQLRNEILQRLVKQQLIMQKLDDTPVAATDDEVNLEISRMAERLTRIDKTLDDFLTEKEQTRQGLRFSLKWQLSWKRYLERTLSDQVLERYFERHRRKFDGTRLRVAHVLLKLAADADPETESQLSKESESIISRIKAGELSWDNAVAEHSDAPSASRSGDIGKISWDGPMPRSFTEAAFELKPGEISPPIRTRFGFHLIQCLEDEPGQSSWYDVQKQVRLAATEELFELLATQQRKETEVRFPPPSSENSPENNQ